MDQVLRVLLSQLAADIDRHDGESAVNTLLLIHTVDPEFAEVLIFCLLQAGLRRVLAQSLN